MTAALTGLLAGPAIVVVACGGRVASQTAIDPPLPANTDQPDPPPPDLSPSGSFDPVDARANPKPHPPTYADAGVAADGSAACQARKTLQCVHCENCDFFIDTQRTFDALLTTCGRICGDIVIDFDNDGCAVNVSAEANQQSFDANLACILDALRRERWSCAIGTSAWASFGSYCSK